ncbi:PREDICTED: proteoglycan 3-like isoform X2 [Pseudopodoces humilis]|nr:PREDICTED: proteoglycan 3-like isoform X2 [Pseudopodoces humilis]
MWPCLLLALALLGTVPASHPGECPPAPVSVPHSPARPQEHPGMSLPPRRRAHPADTTCLGLGLAEGPQVPVLCPAAPRQLQGLPAGETPPLYYTVVKKLRTYAKAQRYCQDVYRGQLASVHSASRNQELHKLARTYKIIISPWIGAVTSKRQAGNWESYWEDSSPWNYANWAPTQPLHIVTTCTTLSVRDGLWRSRFCLQLRPFICQY